MFLREEPIQSSKQLLQDHDVVSGVLKIIFPGSELNLESDVFKHWIDDLAYNLTPKTFSKVGVMLF